MLSEVRADLEKNRLYIYYGKTGIEEFLDFGDAVLEEAKKLAHGFTILSDLRSFSLPRGEHLALSHILEFATVQQKLKAMGASEIIRVVDPQVRLFMVMAEAEKAAGYEAFLFDDYEEADVALDDMMEEGSDLTKD